VTEVVAQLLRAPLLPQLRPVIQPLANLALEAAVGRIVKRRVAKRVLSSSRRNQNALILGDLLCRVRLEGFWLYQRATLSIDTVFLSPFINGNDNAIFLNQRF
jgi:hypothetical protein